jgi:Uma2 family endonuclease
MALDGLNDYRHQVFIARLVTALNNHFSSFKKYNKYIATPETVVSRNDKKTIPDILVWNYEKGLHHFPEIAIEICKSEKVVDDIQKLSKLFESVESLKEGFVFDFEENIGYRIFRKADGKVSKSKKSSKSNTFKLDLM